MTATTYQVLEPLRHDGQDYAPGDLIDLAADPGLPLVASGVVAVQPATERPTSGKGAAGRRVPPTPA